MICTDFLPWECIPAMCAFQARRQGFHYIHDYSVGSQTSERIVKVIITIVEGEITTKQLVDEFEKYIGQGGDARLT